jgi:hypothetical protein
MGAPKIFMGVALACYYSIVVVFPCLGVKPTEAAGIAGGIRASRNLCEISPNAPK